jgi:hypothetical protein
MPPMTPPSPLDFDHQLGDEIPTKHKEAIRQLYWCGKISIGELESRYKLSYLIINRILKYNAPEHARPSRTS